MRERIERIGLMARLHRYAGPEMIQDLTRHFYGGSEAVTPKKMVGPEREAARMAIQSLMQLREELMPPNPYPMIDDRETNSLAWLPDPADRALIADLVTHYH